MKTGYKPGLWACLTCAVLNIVLVVILSIKFARDNKKQKDGVLKIEGSNVSLLTGNIVPKLTLRIGWLQIHNLRSFLRRPSFYLNVLTKGIYHKVGRLTIMIHCLRDYFSLTS